MIYIVISDIHGNQRALKSLTKFLSNNKYDKIIFTGDLANHKGTELEFVKDFASLQNVVSVRGNCDRDVTHFDNNIINNAFLFDYFTSMKKGPFIVDNNHAICHGSVADENLYMLDIPETLESIRFLRDSNLDLLFFGHIHIPKIFAYDKIKNEVVQMPFNGEVKLEENFIYLVCSGSIGKPKDDISYGNLAIYDSEKKTIKRVDIRI